MNSLKTILRSIALMISGAVVLSSLVIMPVQPAQAALYTFQTHTFTSCGKSADKHLGPTLDDCKTSYNTTWASDNSFFTVPSNGAGIQQWTVPATGEYQIEVVGAQGGSNNNSNGGAGAFLKFNVSLTQGMKLNLLIGQTPLSSAGCNAGGGGGSFIWNSADNSLIGAAGGGGGGGASANQDGIAGSTSPDGTAGTPGANTTISNHDGNPGLGGNGGDKGGAGWHGNGVQGDRGTDPIDPKRPLAGGEGGRAGTEVNASRGGFGGGSGGGGDSCTNHGAGGGGGYSGGAGQEGNGTGGGGGGSVRAATTTLISSGATGTGDGEIVITALGKFSLTDGNGAVIGLPMPIPPVIQLLNLNNTPQSATGVVVTVAVSSGATLLAGTNTATSVNGVATFSNLTFASGTVGNVYTLTFTATGYSPAITQTVTLRSIARTIEVSSSPSSNGAFYNGIWLADNTNADSVISSTALSTQLDARPVTLLASASPTTTRMGSVIISAPVTVSAAAGAQLAISASQEVFFTGTEDSRIVSENGPLNLTMQSNSQGGTGRIQMLAGSSIDTGGGDLLASGNTINVGSSIATGVGDLTLKSADEIQVLSGASLSTTAGNLILWSDSDANGEGRIVVSSGTSLSSGTGDIVLAGGLDSNGDGVPDGFASTATNTSSTINLAQGYSLKTLGGDVIIRGESSVRRGVIIQNYGEIDSGTGKISISGIASAGASTHGYGIYFALNSAGSSPSHVLKSAATTDDAISLFGKMNGGSANYSTALGSVFGSGDNSKAALQILATGTGGGIRIVGENLSSAAGNLHCSQISDAVNLNFVDLQTVDGDIFISGTHASLSPTKHSVRLDGCAGVSSGSPSVLSAGGNGTLTITGNHLDLVSGVTLAGDQVRVSPFGAASFTENLSLNGVSVLATSSFAVGSSTNTQGISLDQDITVSDSIILQGGAINASGDLTGNKLGIRTSSTINLSGSNSFGTIEVESSKAGLTEGDISLGLVADYVAGEVSSDITGLYGVPKHLEFLLLPASEFEFATFSLEARVGKDAYGLAMESNNRTASTFTVAKAAGTGTLAGTTTANAQGPDSQTFSDLVISDVPGSGSSISFTIAGAGLTSTTSGLIAFFNTPSADSTLASLGLSAGALSPGFGASTFSYQATVPTGTSSITFTPTASNADHQQIEITHFGGSAIVSSGQPSSGLALTFGLNTFDLQVTAEDGSTTSYRVTVFRQLAEQVDWVYGSVSITQPNGSVSTASAFTDIYGDTSRNSALSDTDELDIDGLPQKIITLKVGEVLHLPMTSNYGNSMGYGGITGVENQICKIDSFTRTPGTQSGAYTIRALRAGVCDGVFVSVHQRTVMVMLSLGARGIDVGDGFFRTPHVKIVVERKDQTQAAIFNGNAQATSTAAWNAPQTLEIRTTEQMPFGDKSYAHVSGPCTVITRPVVFGGVSYFFAATAEVIATGTGTCVIEGSQAQDTIYNAKTWTHTITFTQATQTLAFTSNVPAEPIVGSTYSPTATSSAMLPVAFAVTTGNGTVCNINGSGDVSFIATGSCTIQATQAGDSNYLAAPTMTQTLVVGTANQSITFNQIPDKEIGNTAFRAMANATSGLVVSFTTVTSNTICTVSGAGLVMITGEGQCLVTANQAGNSQVGAAQSVTRVFTIRPEGSSAPFITAVSYGDGSLTATLIAPSFTGGHSILDYSLFAHNASNQNIALVTGCNASAVLVQCTVTGLTNGQPYTLKAAARTSAGLGSLSGPSQAVTPFANPQAVNGLTAFAGNETLTISWQPPSSLGGGDFARFDIRIRPAGGNFPGLSAPSATISSITESSYVFTGLQNGVSYDVEMITITTEPASGMNAATLQSHTARVLQTPFTRPNAPRNLAAFEVDNAVKIAFAYPDFDGGRQVDEYRVSVNGTTVCTPTQVQVCSVPMATLTSLMSSPFVGGIGFQQQPGSFGFLSTTTQIPITVVAVNDGGTSEPATTTFDLVTGSSTPPPSSGGGAVGAITNLPNITKYSKQVLQSTGDSFTITGTNFALIAEIWAADTKLSFLRSSADVIRITTPELALGQHSLVLRGSFGVVTVQDAISVVQGRIVGESTRTTRTFVDGFNGRSTYLGPTNVAKLRNFVAGVKPGTVIKCYGSIPDRANMASIRLAFKRADRVCDFVQSLNPNIEVVRTWVWKDGSEAWDRSQVRLTLIEY